MAKEFDSYAEAEEAYDNNDLKHNEKVVVDGNETTAGRAKVNAILPDGYNIDSQLDEDTLTDILHDISEEKPKEYTEVANKLRQVGEKTTYKQGFSVGLDDISILNNRDSIIQQAKDDLADVDPKDQKEVARVGGEYSDKIEQGVMDQLRGSSNRFFDMVDAGSRGSPDQLQQMLASPVMLRDANNEPVPVTIDKSYGEGLGMPDYWNALYGARKGTIDRVLQQQKPGEIAKYLIKTVNDQVITEDDCGTDQGADKSVDNKSIIGSVSNENIEGIINKGKVINENHINKLRKNDYDTINVRAPVTCEASKGICKKCYGYDEFGSFPDIGDNVGVKAGQAISEPIQQMTMNSFHSGGIVKGPQEGGAVSGLPRIDQLLTMPNSVSDEATISDVAGEVKDINERSGGGKDIIVEDDNNNEQEHFAPQNREVKVSPGDSVQQADKLTSGIPNPKKVIKKRGIRDTRKTLTDELKNAYDGFNINDNIFETVVKGITDLVRVKDPGDEEDLVPGDYTSFSEVQRRNKNKANTIATQDAEGKTLVDEINTRNSLYRAGDTLSSEDIQELKDEGVDKVQVADNPISYRPELAGINTINNYKPDFMTQIGFNRIKSSLKSAVAEGTESDIHGYDPIPAFAYGAEFGQEKLPGSY